jgi:two-component system sensor histidine kinase KdpD
VSEPRRPDPDALLADLRKEAPAQGRLRVFLGMCPGVGKTYAMLQAARQRRAEGVDVVVGVVETHGRTETAALIEGLPVQPRARVAYRGVTLEELDLDALLARRPRLAVIDELAHSNAPGARHAKRYLDVIELLAAGIDVYTTLNVQHVESRAPVVRQITGVQVGETVPDSVLDRADEIELIDISPEQLRKRLGEGRVYFGDRAATATENFFRESNLTALREMALRLTAERVDQGMREYMRERRIPGPWKARERLLVGIGPSPYAGDLVRWTRRVASALDASWMALHVDDGRPLTDAEKHRVAHHLALARQLGGDAESVAGPRVATELLRVAREQNVTQIVVGKPHEAAWLRLLRGGSLVDQLLHRSGDIDLYVVRPEKAGERDASPVSWKAARVPGREWNWAAALLGAATGTGWLVQDWVGYWSVALFYLLMVVVGALFLRRRAVLAAAVAGALLWNFLFVPPQFTLHIARFHDAMMFLMLIVVALAMGHLTTRMRQREQGERDRQRRTEALLNLTQACALDPETEQGLREALRQIDGVFGGNTALFLRDAHRQLEVEPHAAGSWVPPPKEHSVAAWSYGNRQPAGRFTDTLPGSEGSFWPLQTRTSLMGVLGLRLPADRELDLADMDLMAAFAAQVALALEKDHFRAAFQRAEVIQASNRLRRTLLDNVSHELRTPLTTLKAAVAAWRARHPAPGDEAILEDVEAAASRLNHVVGLLVDSARLETGQTGVKKEWCDLRELVEESARLCADDLGSREVRLDLPPADTLVLTDARLLQQALVHVLRNAGRHTPATAAVDVHARVEEGRLRVAVRDHGPGFAEPERVFDKFYRGPGAASGGLGLGLSIAKGLVSALEGTMAGRNHPDGGAEIVVEIAVETRKTLA